MHIPCNAIKVVEYMQGMQTIIVYHRESHTCSLKHAVAKTDDLITEAIQENAPIGTTGIVRRKHVKAVQQQTKMADVAQLAKKLSGKPRTKQVKHSMVSF